MAPPIHSWKSQDAEDPPRVAAWMNDLETRVTLGTGAGSASVLTTKGDIAAGDAVGAETRLPVGTNTQVLTADSTQSLGVKWAANTGATGATGATGPAGTGSASSIEYQLLADTAVGATTFSLTSSAAGSVKSQGWLIIDAYTAQAEVKKINSVAGAAIVLVSAMKYAHNANDLIVVVHHGAISASLWGVSGNGSTDETLAIQEAIEQVCKVEVNLWLDGQAKTYVVSQPIIFPNSCRIRNMKLRAVSFTPVDTNNAMVMSTQSTGPNAFTADATTDIITTTVAHGIPGDGILVMLKGTALPTGLTSGRIYYAYNRTTFGFTVRQGTNCRIAAVAADATVNVIDTAQFPASGNLNVGATTFTYTGKSATTFTGCSGTPTIAWNTLITGDTVDITAAGSGGFAYTEVNSLEKVYLENVIIDTQVISGLNGAKFALQQPAYTTGFRVDGTSSTSTALTLKGQYSAHFNMELNGVTDDDGSTMLNLSGNGHVFDGIILGHGTDGVYIGPAGATCCQLNDLWTEHYTNGIHVSANGGQAIGLAVSGWLLSFGSPGQVGMRIESGATSSYSITGGRGNAGSKEIIHDDQRGFIILDSEFPGGAVIDYAQASGNVAPTMPRVPKSVSAAYAALISDDLIFVNAGSSALQVTLPTATGINGKLYKIKKTDGTANIVTVATTSSQTIDGVTTKTISAQYGIISVASDGANWMTV